jgi:hypothetical protein
VIHISHTGSDSSENFSLDGTSPATFVSLYYAQSGTGFNAATGSPIGFVVTQLEFTAIPEPSEYGAFGCLGLVGYVWWRRFRLKAHS